MGLLQKYLMKLAFYLLFLITSISFSQDNNCSCCTEKHSQFDFWLGDWQVTNPSGKIVGSNSIKKVQGNCVLQENWVGGDGTFTGTSYNFFNQKTGKWEQIWLDNGGGSLHLKGERIANQMILKSDSFKNIDGKNIYHQITWTHNANGTVRQLWETFVEGEKTKISFDGLYAKID